MHVSPALAAQTVYPFVRMRRRSGRAARGVRIFDFGMGDPREPTDPLIKAALTAALDEATGYPARSACPSCARRSPPGSSAASTSSSTPTELIPTYGSKEAIFLSRRSCSAPGSTRSSCREPGYPVYERGALFAGAEIGACRCAPSTASCPTSTPSTRPWSRTALVWVCYPNNPTGAVAPLEFYERLAEIAGSTTCSPPTRHTPSSGSTSRRVRAPGCEPANMVVFNTLSKRSSMTGYRCGFVAANGS